MKEALLAAHREDLIGSGPKCLIRAVPPRPSGYGAPQKKAPPKAPTKGSGKPTPKEAAKPASKPAPRPAAKRTGAPPAKGKQGNFKKR